MESNYRNKEFEQFIKDNADQYRMFPSENVWKGINSSLHTRRKWYGLGLGLLLLLTGTAVTWVMVSYPVSKNQPATSLTKNSSPVTKSSTKTQDAEIIRNVLAFSSRPPVPRRATINPGETLVHTRNIQEDNVRFGEADQLVIVPERYQPAYAPRKAVESYSDFIDELYSTQPETGPASNGHFFRVASSDRPSAPNELIDYPAQDVSSAYLPKKPGRKISWQLFITPTVSYRKLNENSSFDNALSGGFPFASLSDVNKAVTHKPDMGFQIGLNAGFPVTKNLKIRGGLQFNINRYDIKAFAYNPEVATINLNEPNGINSVSTWTSFRTFNGYKSDWLKNFYFSVSAPIGAELKVIGNSKTYVGVAGTIQPTYIIKDRAYLISTDYKNYAKVPSLIRHVNVNTSFETFVSYMSGKTRWQIGPQVRYQVLSSFHNKYPVKENLFDFGLKVGLTLNE